MLKFLCFVIIIKFKALTLECVCVTPRAICFPFLFGKLKYIFNTKVIYF